MCVSMCVFMCHSGAEFGGPTFPFKPNGTQLPTFMPMGQQNGNNGSAYYNPPSTNNHDSSGTMYQAMPSDSERGGPAKSTHAGGFTQPQ